VHLEQHPGRDVVRLDLIAVDELADERRIQLRPSGRVRTGKNPAQLAGSAQVVDALIPYMSPAAIGCKVVKFAGAPVSAYR
jgi:hypothetical protein